MTSLRLVSTRSLLQINPTGKVRVSYGNPYYGNASSAVFECISCDDLLVWNPALRWWCCSSCGYELTPPEADKVLRAARQQLHVLALDVRRKGPKWGWVMWLLRLLRIAA